MVQAQPDRVRGLVAVAGWGRVPAVAGGEDSAQERAGNAFARNVEKHFLTDAALPASRSNVRIAVRK